MHFSRAACHICERQRVTCLAKGLAAAHLSGTGMAALACLLAVSLIQVHLQAVHAHSCMQVAPTRICAATPCALGFVPQHCSASRLLAQQCYQAKRACSHWHGEPQGAQPCTYATVSPCNTAAGVLPAQRYPPTVLKHGLDSINASSCRIAVFSTVLMLCLAGTDTKQTPSPVLQFENWAPDVQESLCSAFPISGMCNKCRRTCTCDPFTTTKCV